MNGWWLPVFTRERRAMTLAALILLTLAAALILTRKEVSKIILKLLKLVAEFIEEILQYLQWVLAFDWHQLCRHTPFAPFKCA